MSEFEPHSAEKRNDPALPARFVGSYSHKLSDKRQVAIPRLMLREITRESQGDRVVLYLMRFDDEHKLRLYTQSEFVRKLEEVKKNSNVAPAKRNAMVAHISRSAEAIEPDSQGRFVLAGRWADVLNFGSEAWFCGAMDYIEIWPSPPAQSTAKDTCSAADVKETGIF